MAREVVMNTHETFAAGSMPIWIIAGRRDLH